MNKRSRAAELPGMDRRLSAGEYEEIRSHLLELSFEGGFSQELSSARREYTPDFEGRGL